MGFLLLVAAIVVSFIAALIFSPFDLPGMGNIPAQAIGSLFQFYLSDRFLPASSDSPCSRRPIGFVSHVRLPHPGRRKYRTLFSVRYFFIIGIYRNDDFRICMAFFWRRNKEDKFSSSVLGLDKSIEELQGAGSSGRARTRRTVYRAIEKTRDSINTRLDTIFEGRKTDRRGFSRRAGRNAHLDRHRRCDDDADTRVDQQGRFAGRDQRSRRALKPR